MAVACIDRVRQHRIRRRNGDKRITVTVTENYVAALVEAKLLSVALIDHDESIAHAAQRQMEIFAAETIR
jgi:hypothetical protein